MGYLFEIIFRNQWFSDSFKNCAFCLLSPVYQNISILILLFDRKSPLWRNKNEWTQQPFTHYLQNGKNSFTIRRGFITFEVTQTLLHPLLLDNWKQRTKWPCKCKLWWSCDGIPLGKLYSKKLLNSHLCREFTVTACLRDSCYFKMTLQSCFVVNF